VLCRIRPGRAGACSRYANENGQLVRTDPVVLLAKAVEDGGKLVEFGKNDWDGQVLDPQRTFVTAIGAGTTYPDYKPAPFIVSAVHEGVDTVTVVTEGIFSYCGVKVKIDTDRHLGPEAAVSASAASRSAMSRPPNTAPRCSPSAACGTSPAARRRRATSPATPCSSSAPARRSR
jgi:hypothetical protein